MRETLTIYAWLTCIESGASVTISIEDGGKFTIRMGVEIGKVLIDLGRIEE